MIHKILNIIKPNPQKSMQWSRINYGNTCYPLLPCRSIPHATN